MVAYTFPNGLNWLLKSGGQCFLWLFLTCSVWIGLVGSVYAQQPTAASSTSQEITGPEVDSLPVLPFLFTFSHEPEKTYPAADTLPDYAFRMYDPARRHPIDWGTIGNIGSAARPLMFAPREQAGFDHGFHGFSLCTNLSHKTCNFTGTIGPLPICSSRRDRSRTTTNYAHDSPARLVVG